MAKIYDEAYEIEIYTENSQRWVKCSCGATSLAKSFKTREELNKIINDYIEDIDKITEYTVEWGL